MKLKQMLMSSALALGPLTGHAEPQTVVHYKAREALSEILPQLPTGIQSCDGESYQVQNLTDNGDLKVTFRSLEGNARQYVAVAEYDSGKLDELTLDLKNPTSDKLTSELIVAADVVLFDSCLKKQNYNN